jgi:hypothetical protein
MKPDPPVTKALEAGSVIRSASTDDDHAFHQGRVQGAQVAVEVPGLMKRWE